MLAQVIFYAVLLLIFFSVVGFCVETVPAYEHWWFWPVAEAIVVAVFTIEVCLRAWAWPGSQRDFWPQPLVLIDCAAVVPFYLGLALYGAAVWDLRWLRVCRLARIFKFGRYSSQLQLMGSTLAASFAGLSLLVLMLGMTLLLFSTMLWAVERGEWDADRECYALSPSESCSGFQSIPHAMWWGITTITTVGYGDTYPVTHRGQALAGAAMVSGIVMLALPATVLAVRLREAYSGLQAEQAWRADTTLGREAELAALKAQLRDAVAQVAEALPLVKHKASARLQAEGRLLAFDAAVPRLASDVCTALDDLVRLVDAWSPGVQAE